MTTLTPIAAVLAEGGDATNIIFLVIIVVVTVIAGIAKKFAEKKQQEQQERERAERAAQAARQPHPPPQQRRQPQRLQPQHGLVVTAEVAEPLDTLGAGVAGEVQRLRQQRAATERQRAARMTTRTPPEADNAAIEKRLVRVGRRQRRQSGGKATSASRAAVKVHLLSRAAARRAMVHFEIFSPPKALRKGGEMWDA